MARPNRIELKTVGKREEAIAAGIFKPGHLLELTSVGKVQKHSVAGGAAELLFALEDALQGKTVIDAYAVGDVAFFIKALPGDEVLARLAQGQDVAIAAVLKSDGAGALTAQGGTGTILARAIEAVDNNPGTGEEFIRVRVGAT
jgi:acyl CoA:acetate/3-ketoacid CoA transferase alpha subunit